MNDKPRKSLGQLQVEADAEDGGTRGLVCPRCGWTSLPVLYMRRLPNREMSRVRQCRRCGAKVLCKERMVGEIGTPKSEAADPAG